MIRLGLPDFRLFDNDHQGTSSICCKLSGLGDMQRAGSWQSRNQRKFLTLDNVDDSWRQGQRLLRF